MARPRKTIKVDDLRKKANNFILNTQDDMVEQRLSVGRFLESVLMDTNNYHGFGYLDRHNMIDSVDGTTVGINTNFDGSFMEDYELRFKDTDRSRVFYY